jgi:hypothetical protein
VEIGHKIRENFQLRQISHEMGVVTLDAHGIAAEVLIDESTRKSHCVGFHHGIWNPAP